MIPEKHDLADEFPSFRALLKTLDKSNPEFHELCTQYESIDEEIIHYETEAGCSDHHLEELKKHRLKLKDQIYFILTHP